MLSIGPVATAGAALPPSAATGRAVGAAGGAVRSAVVPLGTRLQPASGTPASVGASGSPAAGSPVAESSTPQPPPPSSFLVQLPHASLLLSLLAHPDALPVASLGGVASGRSATGAAGGIVVVGARAVHGAVPAWLQSLVFAGTASASAPAGHAAVLPGVAAGAWRQWRDAGEQADALNALAAEAAGATGGVVTLHTAASRVGLQQQEIMLRAAAAFHDAALTAFMPRPLAADATPGASATSSSGGGARKRDWMDDDEAGAAVSTTAGGGGAPAASTAAAAKPLSPHDILATGRAVALHAATAVAIAQASAIGYQAAVAARAPLVAAVATASGAVGAVDAADGARDWARLLLEPTASLPLAAGAHAQPLLLAAVAGTLAELRAAGSTTGDAAARAPQTSPAYTAGCGLAFAAALRATFDALLAPIVAACRGLRANAAVWAAVSADGELPSPFDASDIEAAAAAPAHGAGTPVAATASAASTAEYDEEDALALQAAAYGATAASPATTSASAGGHVRDVLLGAAGAGRSPTSAHSSASGSFSFSVPPSPYAAAVSEHLVAIAHQLAPPLHPLVSAVRRADALSSSASDIPRTLAWHALLSALEMPHLGDVERGHVYTAVAGLPPPPAADADPAASVTTPPAMSPALTAAVAALGIVPSVTSLPSSGGAPAPASDVARAVETLAGEAAGIALAAGASVTAAGGSSLPADSLLASAHAIATAEAALWLQAVVRACCCLLLYELLRVPRLESGGVRQLVADYEHIAAVFAALQVRPDPLLQWFVALARMPQRQLAKLAPAHLQALAKVAELPPAPPEALVSLHKTVARMRGAPVTL